MDSDEREWTDVKAAWRGAAGAEVPPQRVRAQIARVSRRNGLLLALEALISVALPLLVFDGLRHNPEVVTISLTAALILHLALVWVFVAWNRRGSSAEATAATLDFLIAGIERSRRQERSLVFLAALTALEWGARRARRFKRTRPPRRLVSATTREHSSAPSSRNSVGDPQVFCG